MDNPQPKVSDIEYGWVAGFFDGEGSLALPIRPTAGKNESPKIYPLASVTNTNMVALDALTDILNRAEIAYYVRHWRPQGYTKAGKAYKMAWMVQIGGFKRCGKFIRWILPALREKKQRGEVMLDYILARESHSDHRTPISEHELTIALNLKYLNQKGKGQPYSVPLALNTTTPGASSEQLARNGLKGAIARWGIRD